MFAGASREGLIRLELPMIMVTAMVSPKARPRASMIPPTMPENAAGIRTRNSVPQRVAPKPKAPYRRSSGSEARASREIAVTVRIPAGK